MGEGLGGEGVGTETCGWWVSRVGGEVGKAALGDNVSDEVCERHGGMG